MNYLADMADKTGATRIFYHKDGAKVTKAEYQINLRELSLLEELMTNKLVAENLALRKELKAAKVAINKANKECNEFDEGLAIGKKAVKRINNFMRSLS
jgi:hypothetical protein